MEDLLTCQSCRYFKQIQVNSNSILYTCTKKNKPDLPLEGTLFDSFIKSSRPCYIDKNKGGGKRWRKHYPQKLLKKS